MRQDLGRTWWQDAVIYEVYPRSFADADGDGEGDLVGLASRLHYLAELGVDAICPGGAVVSVAARRRGLRRQ